MEELAKIKESRRSESTEHGGGKEESNELNEDFLAWISAATACIIGYIRHPKTLFTPFGHLRLISVSTYHG